MKIALSLCLLAVFAGVTRVQGAATVPSLMCTGAGLYPDPYDCNAYHFCTAKKRGSEPRRCPTGQAFHYISSGSTELPCKQLTSAAECLTIQCNPLVTYQQYEPANQFYASCIGTAIYMYRCADGKVFNGYGCYFACPAEGLYQDSTNPNTYYECAEDLSYHSLYCPSTAVMPGDIDQCFRNF